MDETPVPSRIFPCRPGARIDFEWGLGTELLLTEASTLGTEAQLDNGFGTAHW